MRSGYSGGRSKYGAKSGVYGGKRFDSKREARRYAELVALEEAGAIKNLRRQVKYILIPAQREPDTVGIRGGIKRGALLERECAYVADFVYTLVQTGEEIVEDSKGFRTDVYVIKRKLMLYVHGIKIREV